MGWSPTGLGSPGVHRSQCYGLAVAMQHRISIWFYWSSVFLALGTVLFSGSLYCLALSISRVAGRLHLRIGGVSFLAGWALVDWCYPFKAQGRKS